VYHERLRELKTKLVSIVYREKFPNPQSMSGCSTYDEESEGDDKSWHRSRSWGSSHEEFYDNYEDSKDEKKQDSIHWPKCEEKEDWFK